jgi:hypothetical protein
VKQRYLQIGEEMMHQLNNFIHQTCVKVSGEWYKGRKYTINIIIFYILWFFFYNKVIKSFDVIDKESDRLIRLFTLCPIDKN